MKVQFSRSDGRNGGKKAAVWMWFCGVVCLFTWGGCAVRMKQPTMPYQSRPLPADIEQARVEVYQLNEWIRQQRGTVIPESYAPPPPTAGKALNDVGASEYRHQSLPRVSSAPKNSTPSMYPVSPSAVPMRKDSTQSAPVLAYRRRQDRPMTRCERLCLASRGICRAAGRICGIFQRFPTESSFQRACSLAQSDCKKATARCRVCRVTGR